MLGRRVVVTRSEAQAASMCERLRALEAVPVAFPVIRFESLPAPELDALLARPDGLAGFDWLVLTSVNAVEFLFARLGEIGGGDLPPIAVVGDATARALSERGFAADLVPEAFRGETLVEEMASRSGGLAGRRVLFPRSRRGRPEITRSLEERGARVTELALYDTVRAKPSAQAVAQLRRGFDAVTFTSPSSVRNFLALLEAVGVERRLLDAAVVACIGPVTADEARAHGLEPGVVPTDFTVPDLVDALAEHFAGLSPDRA